MSNVNQDLDGTTQSNIIVTEKDPVFIFLGGHNFWEGLYDTVNISFIENLFAHQLTHQTTVLMTTIIPSQMTPERLSLLIEKEEKLRLFLQEYKTDIQYYHIKGRSLQGLIRAVKEIRQIIKNFNHCYIWAQNYFNCFIGAMLKRHQANTHLHFDMRGLVPQEELHHSHANIVFRIVKFYVLSYLEQYNLNKADSVSTVSKIFKDHIIHKHHLQNKLVEVLPNFYDQNKFFLDETARNLYRHKHQINDHHILILYSGMLQKWQDPDLLFSFIKNIQDQDVDEEIHFIILTYDNQKAQDYVMRYGLRQCFISNESGSRLNSIYNAADIGLAFRDSTLASVVSSPVKIPEYLATGNSVILLESIGDFGRDLKNKKYALALKNRTEAAILSIDEVKNLSKPDRTDLLEITNEYSIQNNFRTIRNIINS